MGTKVSLPVLDILIVFLVQVPVILTVFLLAVMGIVANYANNVCLV